MDASQLVRLTAKLLMGESCKLLGWAGTLCWLVLLLVLVLLVCTLLLGAAHLWVVLHVQHHRKDDDTGHQGASRCCQHPCLLTLLVQAARRLVGGPRPAV